MTPQLAYCLQDCVSDKACLHEDFFTVLRTHLQVRKSDFLLALYQVILHKELHPELCLADGVSSYRCLRGLLRSWL
jgi:hypothetical protein